MYNLKDAKNYTPHDIDLVEPDGTVHTFPSVGVCRAKAEQQRAFFYDWERDETYQCGGQSTMIEVVYPPEFDSVDFGGAEPGMANGVIVSVVAAGPLATSRPDLTIFVPDTGPGSAIRDGAGMIRGVRRLVLWHDPFAHLTLRLVEPLDPANPYDGWRVVARYRPDMEGLRMLASELDTVHRGQGFLMISDPWGQPYDRPAPADVATNQQCMDWARKVWRARAPESPDPQSFAAQVERARSES